MALSTLTPRWRSLRSSGPLVLIAAAVAWPGRWALRPAVSPDPATPIAPYAACPGAPPIAAVSTCGVADWPEDRLEGEPAKRVLLSVLTAVKDRVDRVGSYTATLYKRERIGGILGPEERIDVKVRHRPFAVYLKYRGQKEGREALYAEGRDDNKVVAHTGDWTSRLVPRLTLDPTSALAMVDNRHPITEAGLAYLVGKLYAACRLDLDDPGATTLLDRFTEDGRSWLRSVQTYACRSADRPLCRVEVCYDAETRLPLRFSGDEWPEPGRSTGPQLGESYRYEDLRLDAGLPDADFDSGNPAYAFARR